MPFDQWMWFIIGFGPAISILSGIVGGLIVGLYIHKVIIPKLEHITDLTNSTLSTAHERIAELQKQVEDLQKAAETYTAELKSELEWKLNSKLDNLEKKINIGK